MKSFIFITLALLSVKNIDAQEYFFNFVDGWSNNYAIETEDGYILMGLKEINGGGTQHKYLFNEIDQFGDLIDTVDYEINGMETTTFWNNGAYNVVKIDEENYIIAGYVGIDLNEYDLEGTLVNYNLPTQEFTLIAQSQNGVFTQYNTLFHPNDSTLLVGENLVDDDLDGFDYLLNLDMQGNERWRSDFYIGCEYCHVYPKQILSLSNGTIANLYTYLDYSLPGYYEREKAIIVFVDGETGETIDEPIYPGDEDNYRIWSGGMLEMDNGDLLVSFTDRFYYDETGEWQYNDANTIHIERYSQEGELLLEKTYLNEIPNAIENPGMYEYRVTQMQWLIDGNILISGSSGFGGLLMKIDPEGNLIWYREHFPEGSEENDWGIPWFTHIHHALATSDGGFLCTGEYLNSPGPVYPSGIQTAFALKVDEYGCLEQDCQVGIEEYDKQFLEVYPNPSIGEFNIILPEYDVSDLMVYDVTGKVVVNETDVRELNYLLDMTIFEAGIYFINVQSKSSGRYFSKIIKR